ncbi:MAG: TetR/AcrR family transcriptional regulator [Pseudomonadota bacterium]|nr:TetR/AcrR family transcriptional regulator [Pseudomonadota bacterium]
MKVQRRTQEQRSDAMRERIIEAVLTCLEQDGYASTTVSRIVEVAGVSRGAPLHHFDSKAHMIAAAAERLIRQQYFQLGQAIAKLHDSEDRLEELIFGAWRSVFDQPDYIPLMQLMAASQHDKELAVILQRVWTSSYFLVGNAADHYLEPIRDDTDVRSIIILTQWLLRGMAEDLHIVADKFLFDRYLKLWCDMIALHIRARPGVNTPPTLPPNRDISLNKF